MAPGDSHRKNQDFLLLSERQNGLRILDNCDIWGQKRVVYICSEWTLGKVKGKKRETAQGLGDRGPAPSARVLLGPSGLHAPVSSHWSLTGLHQEERLPQSHR